MKRPSLILARTCVELAGLGLRQEADLAEVDAEDRHVDLGHGTNGAQERPVATEDDEGIGRRELADEDLLVARLGLPVVDAAHLAPAGGAGTQLDGRLDRRVVGEPDPLDGHGVGDLGDPVADLGATGPYARGGPGTRDCPPDR